MQNVGQEIACLVIILGASAVGQPALANHRADASDQDASDAGRRDSAGLVDSDMGIGHLPNLAPGDGGTANVEDAAPPQNGGLQAELLPDGISQPPNTPGAENRRSRPTSWRTPLRRRAYPSIPKTCQSWLRARCVLQPSACRSLVPWLMSVCQMGSSAVELGAAYGWRWNE